MTSQRRGRPDAGTRRPERGYSGWMRLNRATPVLALVVAAAAVLAVSPDTVVTALTAGQVSAATPDAPTEPAATQSAPETEPTQPRQPRKEPQEEPAGDGVPGDLTGQIELGAQDILGRVNAAPYSFGLAMFNILGSNHTRPGSDADHKAPGTIRTEWAVSYLERRSTDLIGFSEIQRDQLAVFMRATRNAFDAWPGGALGGVGVPQTLVWRKSVFTAVSKSSITIPFMGQRRPQPVVKLRHNETGGEFWVVNVHNAPRDREAERDRAQALEIATIKDLRATGLPVFFMGDMNEKEEIFCLVTGQTDLESSRGGSNDGACRPPRGMNVDHIFASPEVDFTSFVVDKSATVRRISDHPLLAAKVTIS